MVLRISSSPGALRGSSPGGARCGPRPGLACPAPLPRPAPAWRPATPACGRGTPPARGGWARCDRFGVVEVVAELGRVGLRAVLARGQLALQPALGPQPLAQLADQCGVLGPALAEDVAHAVEHRVRIGEAGLGIHEGRGLGQRLQRRVGEQPVGQRLQPASRAIMPLVRRLGL
jgi:hypothetical protein